MKELSAFKRINLLKCCDIGMRMTHFGLPRVNAECVLLICLFLNDTNSSQVIKCRKIKQVKLFLPTLLKAYRGSGIIAPLILNLGTMWRWEVSHTPWPIYSVRGPRHTLNGKQGGPHSQSRNNGEDKNKFPLSGFERWTVQPSNQVVTLSIGRTV
jgi:hypothetical protein